MTALNLGIWYVCRCESWQLVRNVSVWNVIMRCTMYNVENKSRWRLCTVSAILNVYYYKTLSQTTVSTYNRTYMWSVSIIFIPDNLLFFVHTAIVIYLLNSQKSTFLGRKTNTCDFRIAIKYVLSCLHSPPLAVVAYLVVS
jgi:hypothetical protein